VFNGADLALRSAVDGRTESMRVEGSVMSETLDAAEIQAKAALAAALIVSRAVEVPNMPERGCWLDDPVATRLREMTEYLYQIVASPQFKRTN
jgi:hypothetical protein